jgi:hypothetical protein
MTPRQRTFGHLALHYMPGDEKPARHLLELLGCTLVDNGPDPGNDGFCTVHVNASDTNHADNIFFLSQVAPEQLAIEHAIADALHAGDTHELLHAYRTKTTKAPESISHIGIRYADLAELESVLEAVAVAAAPGGALEGRAELVKYAARPGLDADVDARMASSPAFTGDERPAFADHWVQCFVTTDLLGFGILALGHTFELDFIFDPFFSAPPPSFGRPRGAALSSS